MNAYFFTAVASRSQARSAGGGPEVIQTWDDCPSLVVLAPDAKAAQARFEDWLCAQPEGESRRETLIRRISAAQFVDQWFDESGGAPLDWPKIAAQAEKQLESTAADDFEQGYWLNVDEVIVAGRLSFNIDALRRELPEDVESGLNWSAEKQFLFIVSVLAPMVVAPPPEDEDPDAAQEGGPGELTPGELYQSYPQARDKDAAALVLARNSAVAAWLWRRYASGTALAANEIRIDPWCGALGAT